MKRSPSYELNLWLENNNVTKHILVNGDKGACASFEVVNGDLIITVQNENDIRIIKDSVHESIFRGIASKFAVAFGFNTKTKDYKSRYSIVKGKNNTSIGTIEFNPLYNNIHSIVKPPYVWISKPHIKVEVEKLASINVVSEIISSNFIKQESTCESESPEIRQSSPLLYFVSDL